jgi:hypothetical protein
MSKRRLKRPPTTPKKCIFCSRTGLSEEHIWPVWSHEFVPKSGSNLYTKKLQIAANQSAEKQDVSLTQHNGDITSMRVKVVCKTHCNNGWMSRLEQRAKPILVPLITGAPIVLSHPNQEIVATWIATKLLTIEAANPDPVTPAGEFPQLMGRRRPPEIMRIWIGHFKGTIGSGAYHRQAASAPLPVPFGGLSLVYTPKKQNIQTQMFIIGQLFVQAVTTTVPALKFNPPPEFSNVLRQIWPYERSFAWPLAAPLSDHHAASIGTALERTSVPPLPTAPPSMKIPRTRL